MLKFDFDKIKPENESKTYRELTKIIGAELSNISKACYLPKINRYFSDLQKQTGVSDELIKEFKKNINPKYKSFNLYQDKITIMLMLNVVYYLRHKKENLARAFFRILGIKFYSSILHRFFPKFCSEELWIMALDSLSPKHLFKIHKGTGGSVMYISDFDFNKRMNDLKNLKLDDKDLVMAVYGLRTKIFQSSRSFAESYYRIQKEKQKPSATEDDVSAAQLIAEKYSMLICTYGQIDKLALSKAIINSGVRKDLAITIVSEMASSENRNKLKYILILLGRIENFKVVCNEQGRNKLVRQVLSDVKVLKKYSVKEEIKGLMYELPSGYQMRTIYDTQLVNFFMNYITIFIQNRIC
ncbi:MAG: hypothetical protein KAS32_29145 [Candidatus Peribacteraceae bacterium]|nr:hypothetical protein [Candidatus Peribacteraceae bacterium]